MNSQPLVNVVINCFNGEKYIKESDTPEKYVWEIFCDELSKNEKKFFIN